MSVKILSLELENVKRVALVRLEPSEKGLTVIGGDNRQGKTSILDGICYALGGEKYRPSNLQREGSAADARMKIELSNGLVAERKGKNASLKVTDPSGQKAGQTLLDSFIDELALNLPKFRVMNSKEKAKTLLRILGIEQELEALDREEQAAYDERHAQGRVADQKEKYAAEMPEWHDVPDEPMTANELVKQSQAIMARNAERQNAREHIEEAKRNLDASAERVTQQQERIDWIKQQLADAEQEMTVRREQNKQQRKALEEAQSVEVTPDESTAEVEAKMNEIEDTNAKVRQNLDKRKAMEDAEVARAEYARLSEAVEAIRARRMALLDGADMPLPELSIEDGELTYNGKAWDCMSGVEQVQVSVAIVQRLKPECGFVLLDGLEAFDGAELGKLGDWLETQDLQAIATRVSRGEECSLIIEDGMVKSGGIVTAAPAVESSQNAGDDSPELDW